MRHVVAVACLLLISAYLVLTGVRWGLPDDTYRKYYYSNEREMNLLSQGISGRYVRESMAVTRGKAGMAKLPRSTFNIIRSFHPDEQNILKSIGNMRPEKGDFNPHFFDYPTFFIYQVAVGLKLLAVAGAIVLTSSVNTYYAHPGMMAGFYLAGRCLAVLYALLTVWVVYWTGVRLGGERSGLGAAAVTAFSPVFILNSHYLAVDVPMIFWSAMVLFLLIGYVDTRARIRVLAAGICLGLAVSTKYPAVVFWPLIPLAVAWSGKAAWRRRLSDVALASLCAVAAFLVTSPYVLVARDEFLKDIFGQVTTRMVNVPNFADRVTAFLTNTGAAMWAGHWTLSLLFLPALAMCLAAKDRRCRLLAVAALCALFLLSTAGGFKYCRYYLLVLPACALMTGVLVARCASVYLAGKRTLFPLVGAVVLFLLPLAKSIAYVNAMSRRDSRIQAAEYIHTKLKPGTTVIFTRDPWIFEVPPVNTYRYRTEVRDETALSGASRGSYLVIGELQYFLHGGSRPDMERDLIQRLRALGFTPAFRFDNEPALGRWKFDQRFAFHDMLYVHPRIYILTKYE